MAAHCPEPLAAYETDQLLSAVRALADENVFDTIRLFERRNEVGGIWYI